MNAPLVLLVSRSASRTQAYRVALDQLGISCLGISSMKEVPVLTAGTPFSGILVDMPVLIRTCTADKVAVEDTLKALPSAYLNIAPATDAIKLLIATGTRGDAKSLEEFALLCKQFPARMVRPNNRYPLYLHTLLTDPAHPELVEKSVTINLSTHGCFLFSCNPDLQTGRKILIECLGLTDRTPIGATICWQSPWGSNEPSAPGIGVRFDRISNEQLAQITSLLERCKAH